MQNDVLVGSSPFAAALTSNWSSPYNISLKLAGSLLTFPSRFLTRIRKIDEMFGQDAEIVFGNAHAHVEHARHGRSRPDPTLGMPGPWGFLTSGYAVGLLATVFLLNRIQNIVVPPRRAFLYHLTRSHRDRRSLFRAIFYSIFPVNISSTGPRLILRLPTLYLMSKAVVLMSVILLQTANLFPPLDWPWLHAIHQWAAQQQMDDVCWFTFCAVCATLSVTAFTRGLEGTGGVTHAQFNFFGYAFLLHIYSSPITHVNKNPDMPSRPDKHVMVTILMPILQLLVTHFMDINEFLSKQRLIPTAICGLLTLAHFHVVLWQSPSLYPLLNYLPCLLESLLLAITLLVCTLNALTQLLLEGTITRPLFGHAQTLLPKWEEDFSVVLLRLGTASIEATSVAGLGNEVGGVSIISPPGKGLGEEDGVVEINGAGVTSLLPSRAKGQHANGFANEIRSVKAVNLSAQWEGVWNRELLRFGLAIGKVMRGMWRLVWGGGWRQLREGPPDVDERAQTGLWRWAEDDEEEEIAATYERFLRGETMSDDEDDEFHPPEATNHSSNVSSDEEEDDEGRGEAVNLYSDLSQSSTPNNAESAHLPILLAHMTDTSASPLTRRRYTRLLTAQQDEWTAFVADRRSIGQGMRGAAGRGEEDALAAESRRNCVVCTAEPREVICWPCRCLALCNDCRSNLASRFPPSKHTCPCCRRSVEGYSRIFIP